MDALGVILVESKIQVDISQMTLMPPLYRKVIGSFPEHSNVKESYRSSLAVYFCHNRNLTSPGIPSPFLVLTDMYRIVLGECQVVDTCFKRDLAHVQWALTLHSRGTDLVTPERQEEAFDTMTAMTRRLRNIKSMLDEHEKSCDEMGRPGWVKTEDEKRARAISKELSSQFKRLCSSIDSKIDPVDETIHHLTSLASLLHSRIGIKEAQRSYTQNNIVMVLAPQATFFLPLNAVAAIVSMSGDWAPGQAKFPTFWGICVVIIIISMGVVMIFRFWDSIVSFFGQADPGEVAEQK